MLRLGKLWRFGLATILITIAACGGNDSEESPNGVSGEPGVSQAVADAPDLPASLSASDYYRLRDAIDNDEVPQRVVAWQDPDNRLEFSTVDAARKAFVEAVADGDFKAADRVFASVPTDWRLELENAGHDAAADAHGDHDYAVAYRFDRYLNFDHRAFWMLDANYVEGRVTETGSGTPVQGATITYEESFPASVESNASGEFRILLPVETPAGLLVEHPDYDPKRIFNASDGGPITAAAMRGRTLEIFLGTGFPKLTFRGRVVDAETREPLAGVPVVAGFDPIGGATELNLKQAMGGFARETDADGRFEIPDLPVADVHVLAQALVDGKTYQLKETFRFDDGVEHVFEVEGRSVQLNIPLIVAGTVKDRVTGEPIQNAAVSAGGWKTERTDVNGRFIMKLETGKSWQLVASHAEYHQGPPQPFSSPSPKTVESEFLLDPITTGTILGTAINAATGEPIANAVIEIAGQKVRTDSQGRFRAEEIEAGEVLVSGAQSGYRADSETLLVEALQTAEATLELEPITTGTIRGSVVDETSGRGLEGATVQAAGGSTTTDSDGRFVLEDVEAGPVSVNASMSLYVTGSSEVLLEALATEETEVRLTPITWGTVRGRVVDASTQQTLANATVSLGAVEVLTDETGAYVAERVQAGTVSAAATLARYHGAQASIELPRNGNVEQDLELAPITTGTVVATILDATSGEPVAGANVAIGDRHESSDAAGSVTAREIPAGQITVNATARLYEPASAQAPLEAAGESKVTIELVPITYGTVSGTVVDTVSGAPIADASVSVAGQTLKSDAQGVFRADRVPAGSVSVSAALHRYQSDQQTVELARGDERQVDLALRPITTGTITGVVLHAESNRPVPGANVAVGTRSVRSNDQGRFEIDNVAAGDATVRASLALFEPGEAVVTVEAAATAATELKLVPITYGTIDGTVVSEATGTPIEAASVTVGGRSTRTNSAGEYQLERIPAGDITVVGSKAVYMDDSRSVALAAGGSETVELRLTEITWGVVTGRVTDSDTGLPLANADVVVAGNNLKTGPDGRFWAEKVPAGSVQVTARLPAYEPGSAAVKLNADGETSIDLPLDPIRIGDIAGQVVDAKTGEPIAKARITTGTLAAESDAGGRFTFSSVSTGNNAVSARHPDYANGSVTAQVLPAESVDVIIKLDLRREDVTNLEAELASSGTIDLYGIYFDSGKDQFKPSSLNTLRAVLEVMKRAPDRRFRIAGHTDSDGGDDFNQDLSERRARTVIRWLVDNGIDSTRLDGVGFGETQPAAPNDTETGKALNRRVQLSFAD